MWNCHHRVEVAHLQICMQYLDSMKRRTTIDRDGDIEDWGG
jgi:hypothetical protein